MFCFRATLPLQTIYLVMVSIGGLLLLTACPIEHISSRHSADAQASIDLFKTHVHPLFKGMKCAGCHNLTGGAKGDPFADEDIATAHKSAETKVDFADIKNSILVTRQVPSSHNCNEDNRECAENADKLIAALTKWQEGRDSSSSKSLLLTDEKDADQGETGDYTDHKLQFAIDNLMNSNASGNVTLEVTASKNSSAKLLTLKNFKLSTTDDHIFLGGLRAKRNGKYSSDLTKMRVCALVKAASDKKSLAKFGEISFSLDDGDSSPNMIAFGLKDLRVATSDDECEGEKLDGADLGEAQKDFDDKIKGIGKIISSNCTASCHNTTATRQGSDISTFGKFYTARQAIISRVDCNLATSADKCMPKSPQKINTQQKQQLLDWLKALPE